MKNLLTTPVMQHTLLRLGALLLLVSAFHVAWWVAFGGSLEGPLSVRRPILFFFAGGLLLLSLGVYLPQLAEGTRPLADRRIAALGYAYLFTLPGLSVIGLQFWRGSETHFHPETTLDLALQALIGLEAIVYALLAALLLGLLLRPGARRDAFGRGLQLGWGLHVVGIVCVGIFLGQNEGQPGPRLDALMRMHALGAHSIQIFPALGWLLLLRQDLGPAQRSRRLGAAALAYGLVLIAFGDLALRRVALADAGPLTFGLLALSTLAGMLLAASTLKGLSLRAHAADALRAFAVRLRRPVQGVHSPA